jgi:hypothetical protein
MWHRGRNKLPRASYIAEAGAHLDSGLMCKALLLKVGSSVLGYPKDPKPLSSEPREHMAKEMWGLNLTVEDKVSAVTWIL